MQLVVIKSPRYIGVLVSLFLFFFVHIAFCDVQEEKNTDPYESINRTIFDFNLKLDKYFLKPVAVGYSAMLPVFVQSGVSNMFAGIGEVPNGANSLLQGKFVNALKSALRLTINLTLGFFCVFDVASELGLGVTGEDFGQTLAVWGVPSGPYVVVPFFGSYTVRSGAGSVVDMLAFDPIFIERVATRNTLFSTRVIDRRASLLDAEELIIGDPYIFVRSVFLQQRDHKIKDGKVEDSFNDMDTSMQTGLMISLQSFMHNKKEQY